MSVFARKSTQITNRDASPQVLNDPGNTGARMRQLFATVLAVAADSATSTYRFFQIPSNAVVSSLKFWGAAFAGTTKFDLGIWDTTLNGGLVVPTTGLKLFASAVDVSGAIAGTDYRFSALATSTAGKQLWDLLGLTADPAKDYDFVINVDTAVTTGGSATVLLTFAQ